MNAEGGLFQIERNIPALIEHTHRKNLGAMKNLTCQRLYIMQALPIVACFYVADAFNIEIDT
jgi:hypothetical protein